MGNRIKGITVEIGGDTTGLDKALRGVNSSITKTQSALNDVNKLLKLDPSNTVLVQKFLNKWTIFLFCSILFSSNQKEH